MADRIVSSIVRRPSGSAASAGQLDGLHNLVSSATNCYNRVVSKVRPDFVSVRNIKRFSRVPAETFCFLDHLACAEVYRDETFVCLARNKKALPFDVGREAVLVAFVR